MAATERIRVGEWVLDPDRFSLIHGSDEQASDVKNIGAQNMALLQYLAAHPNELITRDVLLQSVWRGVIVNDNTLSKAVAELRKALGDESKQARYIVTVPRRGYRLIAPVTLANAEAPTWNATPSASGAGAERWSMRRIAVRSAAGALLVVLMIVLWQWQKPPQPTRERFSQLLPFTSEPGLELQPAFSPDGHWMAYVAFPAGGYLGEIRLKALKGERQVNLPVPNGVPETPVWSPDGNYLAYLLRTPESCKVHVMRLASDTRLAQEDKAVSDCMHAIGVGVSSLQWSADGAHLLFRKHVNGITPLVQFDWRNGNEQVLADIFPYVFAVHPRQPKLAYAEVGTMSTTLSVWDWDAKQKKALLTRPEIFFGLAWDPLGAGILTTRSLVGGQLEYLHQDGRREVILPSADSLIEPAFSVDGTQLAVVQARMTYDLWQADIAANPSPSHAMAAKSGQPLIQSSRFDYCPRFAHSGQRIAFLSTRSGTPAVWLANADGGDQRLVSVLPDAAVPTHVRWSPDDRYLLMGGSDLAAYRYDFVSGQLQRLSPADFSVLNPTWSRDGKAIYVSRQQDNDWNVWRLELASNVWQPVANVAAAMAEESADGKSLYLLRHGSESRSGLWRYDWQTGAEQRLLAQIERRNWQNLSVSETGFYYLKEIAGIVTVHAWDVAQGHRAVFPLIPAQDAGPLFIDFTVSPDQRRIVYTRLADFESDIMLLQ